MEKGQVAGGMGLGWSELLARVSEFIPTVTQGSGLLAQQVPIHPQNLEQRDIARSKGPDSLSPIKSGESHDLVCLHGVDLFQMMELGDEGYTGNFDRPFNEKDSHSLGNGSIAYWPGPATRTGPAPLPPAPGPFLHWAPLPDFSGGNRASGLPGRRRPGLAGFYRHCGY
jgi:hypothetical protein